MTRISEVIRGWLGWCPNAGTIRTAPVLRSYPSAEINPAQPAGSPAGSGRIGRGTTLALGSIRILLRNRCLLWFSLLIGLVMICTFALSQYLEFITGTNLFPGTNLITSTAPHLVAKGSLSWIALTFASGLVSTFLIYYILAALIACVSLILSGKVATIRDGFAHTKRYLRPLLLWSGIWALIGTVYNFIINSSQTTNGMHGNLGMMFIPMVILAVAYILTLFVVPLLVLGNESLINAVTVSISLFRKTWGETLVCFIILFLIAFVVYLISLILMTFGFSTGGTSATSVIVAVDLLVMLILLIIGYTVLGIAIVGLYAYGKTGKLSSTFSGKQDMVETS